MGFTDLAKLIVLAPFILGLSIALIVVIGLMVLLALVQFARIA